MRHFPRALVIGASLFALVWVLFWAPKTTFGPAVKDPIDFAKTFLDAMTLAGVLFVVASGFTLIFGLMRVVNMAHGSLYLLGGYIAYDIQQQLVHNSNPGFALSTSQVATWQWVVPAIVASACIAVIGLVMQQGFLRWNQGQDLRQAMITIALGIILADQMLQHWPIQETVSWPGTFDRFVSIGSIDYNFARLFMLIVAVVVGIALWLWLNKTRTGMIIRAGVDDRQMVSALGVNIQLTFAIAFVVGAALAGLGGAMGGAQFNLAPGLDGQWLLNSLVVVIIGGMGSLGGAAVGAILYGTVLTFSGVYLPTTGNDCCTQYSVVLTFALLAVVLAFRPQGLFGRPG
ncbi:MAG: ABC transporter ATP-binding protein [Candidatus Rokuibacteriota bacterium]|nr:MAG: ABC transporter ATP-binding protein [Candidatus Rokubacteria bacterium]